MDERKARRAPRVDCEIDRDILRSIERRARVALEIAKLRPGTARFAPIADGPHLQALEGAVTPPFPVSAVRPIFTAIDGACRAFDVAPRVAFVGAERGPGWLAARAHFSVKAPSSSRRRPSPPRSKTSLIEGRFRRPPVRVAQRRPDFSTIQAIAASDLKLVGQREAAQVMASPGEPGEVRMRYGVVSRWPSPRSGSDATAMLFSLRERPGALHDVLQHFQAEKLQPPAYPVEAPPRRGLGVRFLC